MQDVKMGFHAQRIISGVCSLEHTRGKGKTALWAAGKSSGEVPRQVSSGGSLQCSNGEEEKEDYVFWQDFPLLFQWGQLKPPLGCSSLRYDYS